MNVKMDRVNDILREREYFEYRLGEYILKNSHSFWVLWGQYRYGTLHRNRDGQQFHRLWLFVLRRYPKYGFRIWASNSLDSDQSGLGPVWSRTRINSKFWIFKNENIVTISQRRFPNLIECSYFGPVLSSCAQSPFIGFYNKLAQNLGPSPESVTQIQMCSWSPDWCENRVLKSPPIYYRSERPHTSCEYNFRLLPAASLNMLFSNFILIFWMNFNEFYQAKAIVGLL